MLELEFLVLSAANMLITPSMTKSLIIYLTYETTNCGLAVHAQFQNQAGSVSIPLLPINVAYTSLMNVCN